MPVDIGNEATDRAGTFPTNFTVVDKNKAASIAGTITSVDFYVARAPFEAVYVGSFYTTNGNVLKCRDAAQLTNLGVGFHHITVNIGLDPLAIAVAIGDFIGCYFSGVDAQLERDTFGTGYWAIGGMHINPADQETYTPYADRTISLGGYITEPPTGWTGKISGVTNPAKIMGVAIADIQSVKGIEAS